jgi:hypothetical protein
MKESISPALNSVQDITDDSRNCKGLKLIDPPVKNSSLGCRDNSFYQRCDSRVFVFNGMSDFLEYEMSESRESKD